ncbi:methyl-accepting chemotaxis protein [Halomicroarcula limicola]|uniref:Methyl-accepting chemotaxis protein n=1 Tax=Haloarcula limicola TaxID=1429915 RepID=A0A8J7Y5V3_9EURY|nr:methyl-accepting chemotaxis protein [Halomicroarcula limicola]MBV0925275.1 methyl-accepting chemotaxis protein [Halomicroarcula limicola]
MSNGGPMDVVRTITPSFVRRSFALKFFIALLCIGLLVGAVGAVGTQQITGEFEQQVRDEHATTAKQEADSLAAWNEQNQLFAETMARAQPVRAGNVSEIQSAFDAELRARELDGDDQPNLHYVDTGTGVVTASTKSNYRGEDVAILNETVRAAIEEGATTAVTDAYTDTPTLGSPQPRIAYVTPAENDDDAVVVYTVPLDTRTGELSGTGSSVGMVVDGSDRVLFHQKNNDLLLTPYGEDNDAPAAARESGPASPGSIRAGPARGALNGSASMAGEEYVVGYAQVLNTDWVVLIHTNTAVAYGTVRSVADRGLIATALGVAAIGAIGAVLGRNTASSLNRLTRKTERMQEGDLDVEIHSERVDTVGRLYAGFGAMRDSLRERLDEVERERKRAEVARDEVVETNAYLQSKAAEYSEVMEQAAAGDLTQRMETDGQHDAMDAVGEDFNEMIEELEKTTGQLKSFAGKVEESGTVVGTSAASVRDAAEQVAESIQMISDDAHMQREELRQATEAVDAAVAALDDGDVATARDRLGAVAGTLNDVADATESTMAESENVAGAAEEQAAELNEVSARADELVRYVGPLYDVLDRFETESEHQFVFTGGPSIAQDDD